jgi:hypothetical protein
VRGLLLSAFLGAFSLGATDRNPIFWRDPGPIESLDLAGGVAGRNKAPKPPFAFIEEPKGGSSPKVTVRDARGVEWIVKFGEEVKAENFASRIVWVAGYFAEPTYFVGEGQITGARKLARTRPFIDENGRFRNARFELKDDGLRISGSKWNLYDPNLKGVRELAGYKLLFILLSNWDVKPENFTIVNVKGQPIYAVTDWGATMGRASDITGRSKWDCALYTADSQYLLDGMDNGFVMFSYQGKQADEVLRGIRLEDVEWLFQRLGRLSDAQIRAALQASGATPEETRCFSRAFRTRLNTCKNIRTAISSEGTVTHTRRETRIIRK